MARTRSQRFQRAPVEIVRAFPCPHCHREVELVGQSEFDEDEGLRNGTWKLTPPRVKRLRETPDSGFPEPALVFPNRTMWTRQGIEEFLRLQRESKVRGTVDEIFGMPADEAQEVLRQLAERLNSKT